MDIARDKSKFWHRLWSECDREHTGIVYDIMKTARSRYHYLLRALRKKHIIKQNYLSQSQSFDLRRHVTGKPSVPFVKITLTVQMW